MIPYYISFNNQSLFCKKRATYGTASGTSSDVEQGALSSQLKYLWSLFSCSLTPELLSTSVSFAADLGKLYLHLYTVTDEGSLFLNWEIVFALGLTTAVRRAYTFHHLCSYVPTLCTQQSTLRSCSCKGKAQTSAGEEHRAKGQALLAFCIHYCV